MIWKKDILPPVEINLSFNTSMGTRGSRHLFKIFVFHLLCPWIYAGSVMVTDRVYVALAGHNLSIELQVNQLINDSINLLTCFSPQKQVLYQTVVNADGGIVRHVKHSFIQENLQRINSGEYHCEFQNSRAYWVLLVRDEGFVQPVNSELVILGVLTCALLFSTVAGLVYLFRGHRGNVPSEARLDKKAEQKREESREEEEDDSKNAAAASNAFYASLQPRPRSIYDVLHPSATARQETESRVEPKSKAHKGTTEQTLYNQDKGVFESFYENFE